MRRKHNKKVAQNNKSSEERILALEEDLIRVIDLCLDLERRLDSQERFNKKLLHILKTELGTSTQSAGEASSEVSSSV